jgi:hypothetical protein
VEVAGEDIGEPERIGSIIPMGPLAQGRTDGPYALQIHSPLSVRQLSDNSTGIGKRCSVITFSTDLVTEVRDRIALPLINHINTPTY